MNFKVDKQEKYTVIKVEAEKLDTSVAPALKSELVMLNAQGAKNMVVDLSATKYCDSSGLSSILVANRLCKNVEGTFVLSALQDPVKKLITISQLDTILNITPTVDEAVDFLFMEEVERDLTSEE
jgi:anti-sigma B factor antagonist